MQDVLYKEKKKKRTVNNREGKISI